MRLPANASRWSFHASLYVLFNRSVNPRPRVIGTPTTLPISSALLTNFMPGIFSPSSSVYGSSMIVDYAIYVDGQRAVECTSLEETYEAHRQRGEVAWIDLYKPDEEEFSSLAEEFGLHRLAVRDAIEAHQRPKLERYDKTLFIVLKPACYLDEPETVEFSEAHIFVGEDLSS